MSEVEKRLAEKGIEIHAAPIPVAAYLPGVISGNTVYVSGQLPFEQGKLNYTGSLKSDDEIDKGYQAAQICAVNCLSVVKALIGDLDRVTKVVKLCGFVNSAPEFATQPKVVNGASELMQTAFGEKGAHARSAVGVAALPMNAVCEVELIVEFE